MPLRSIQVPASPSIGAFFLAAMLPGLAACTLGCASLTYCPVFELPIQLSHPTTGLLQASSACVETHVQEPISLQATRPSVAWLEPAGAWGDDRRRHAYSTDLALHVRPAHVATLGGDSRVSMWDEDSGKLLWTVDVGFVPDHVVTSVAGGLFVTDVGHDELVALDAATGKIRFRTHLPGRPGALVMSADDRYVIDTGPMNAHVDARRGTLVAASLYDEHDRATWGKQLVVMAFDPRAERVARLELTDISTPSGGDHLTRGQARVTVFSVATSEMLVASRDQLISFPKGSTLRLRFDPEGGVLKLEAIQGGRIGARTLWAFPGGDLLDGGPAGGPVEPDEGVVLRSRGTAWGARKLAASADGQTAAWQDPQRVVWLARSELRRSCALNAMPEKYTGREQEPESFALDAKGDEITLVSRGPAGLALERWDARRKVRIDALSADDLKAITLRSATRAVLERTLLRAVDPAFRRDHFAVDLASPEKPSWLGAQVGEATRSWTLDHALFDARGAVAYATTAASGRLSAWDIPGRKKLHDLGYADAGSPWALSPDGHWLAFEGLGSRLELWDVLRPTRVNMPFPDTLPTAVAFSADSRTVAVSNYDGLVHLFSVPGGELIATADLNPRADAALSLAFGRGHLWIGTARGVLFGVRLAGSLAG